MNNPYKTLGISRTSNIDLARSKYIQLAKKFHPDTSNLTLEISEDKMKQINNAYSLIKLSISRGVVAFRPRGRFTKKEIKELIERYIEGQSLYKIGRDMKRKQRSIRNHLIKAGLMEGDIIYNTYKSKEHLSTNQLYLNLFIKINFIFIISFIMLVEPRLNILELWIFGLIDLLN
tara:strand:+ start:2479 stop:3003 length:525 start_codon:yes stop_codon:yes gene_type:complete